VEALFAPFHQRSDDRTGLGLGLSIARRSIESFDGLISLRDLPGDGCVFTISPPRYTTDQIQTRAFPEANFPHSAETA
jgi:signal transduction histidine kinase